MILYFLKKIREQSNTRLLFSYIWFFVFLFLLSTQGTLIAQAIDKSNSYQEKKTEIAIGYSIIHEKLPEGYNYTPLFVTIRFPIYQFFSSQKSNFSIFSEPQFVLNSPSKPFKKSFEFGVNMGVQYFLSFSKKNGMAISIGVGPHYFSLETAIQAKGFIFSDNFEVGYYQRLGKQFGISIKPRFRHISNAGFLSPNIGIDNFFVMIGVFWKRK